MRRRISFKKKINLLVGDRPIDLLMAVIGTDEAARRLNLSIGRLTTMIRTGIIKAQKIGRTWVLEESEVARVQKLPRPPGRPRKGK